MKLTKAQTLALQRLAMHTRAGVQIGRGSYDINPITANHLMAAGYARRFIGRYFYYLLITDAGAAALKASEQS